MLVILAFVNTLLHYQFKNILSIIQTKTNLPPHLSQLDGASTQGENIADNGGIKLAYRAYNHWVAEHGTEKRLPGLQDFTPLQMFWISAANIWCSKSRLKTKEYQIKSDEHSPREFRVRGPLSNSPEFSKDFNCPAGSKMNPPNKCDVW